MMGFGLLLPLLLIGVLAYALGWLPRGNQFPPRATGGDESADSALDILRARYARGEISKTEFETMRDDLRR